MAILHNPNAAAVNPPWAGGMYPSLEQYAQLSANQAQSAQGMGTNINIRQIENGYVLTCDGKQWMADSIEKIQELVVLIMVKDKLTDAG